MVKSPLTFRIFQAGKLVREETLALGVIKVGKVPSAHLRLDDESVSRMHAIIEVDATGKIQLIDLGSTRGTFVNGAKINKAEVRSGDTITAGDTRIELTVAEAAVPVPMPVPESAPVPSPMATLPSPPPAVPAPRPAVASPVVTWAPPPPVMSAPLAAHLATETDDAGAGAVEVAAMLGDSVVTVKHCMDPRSGQVTRATYAMLGASLVCLATAGVAFGAAVRTASRNADALDYWTHVAKKPAHSFRAESSSGALDALEIGGIALGIAAAATGLARLRRERRSPYFRIGTAPGVELATDAAPTASFPLVAPRGDDFVFQFAPGIDGEMILAGATTPFADLVASGQARPSTTVAGAHELAIPASAKIRARAGATTFLVSAVARPATQAKPGFALDGRAALYAAASLVAHVGLYGLSALGTADAAGIGLETPTTEELAIRAQMNNQLDTPPPPPDPTDSGAGDTSSSSSGRMQLEEGAAGNPTAQQEARMSIRDNHLENPQVARAQAIEYATHAGILGDAPALTTAFTALAGTYDMSNGLDTDNYNGSLYGAAGEGKGNFGMGRNGWGPGGGCVGGDCGGIGVGRYHTIGNGPGHGDGWGAGPGGGNGLPGRHPMVPTVHFTTPITNGDLDRSIIRRYVMRQQEKISYCYQKELMAKPGLEGDITVQFFIAPDGSVRSSNGAGFDPNVAACIADVVHAISFPAPKDGGGVQVNYPFHLHQVAAK